MSEHDSAEADGNLRQRISDALLKAAFSDWDVGAGRVIELPLDVATSAVMTVLGPDVGR